jgi:hypothetical protein
LQSFALLYKSKVFMRIVTALCGPARALLLAATGLMVGVSPVFASAAGTTGASFLEVPVGARPAALGSAYTALADDAYAPVWNPAGLGFLDHTQVGGMHQLYIDQTSFDFLSLVHPLRAGTGLGLSVQYFNPGKLDALDTSGNLTGTFTGYYGAYSLSLGQRLTEMLSLGITGKMIQAKIDDVTANTLTGDAGLFLRPSEKLSLAAVAANVVGKLKFIDQSDPLPQNFRFGAGYRVMKPLLVTGEAVYLKGGPSSFHFGGEWTTWASDEDMEASLRAGYSTDRLKELSAFAGFSTGIGLTFWGQEFSYAWMPLGDFGSTHYFSLVFHFKARPARQDKVMDVDYNQLHDLIEQRNDPSNSMKDFFKD